MNKILDVRYTDINAEKEFCQELLEIAQTENSFYGITFAHTYLGDYYLAKNDCTSCAEHLSKAKYLSEKYDFSDLMVRICNLYGICHESLEDEQTAFQYYLQALPLAKENSDLFLECILLNNIANNFEMLEDYEEAEKYFLSAYEVLNKLPDSTSDFNYIKLRLLSNLAFVYYSLGNAVKMKEYLLQCEQIEGELEGSKEYLLNCGFSNYYALVGAASFAEQYAKKFMASVQSKTYSDQYLIQEMLIRLCKAMIHIRKKEIAKQILDYNIHLLKQEEMAYIQQVQKLEIQFYTVFGTDQERFDAYESYYKKINLTEKMVKKGKAKGLKNIIYLDELKNSLVMEAEMLNKKAHLDELTNLYNRRYLNKMVSKLFQDEKVLKLGFIMIDVDYFKEYNDTYGHVEGDIALRAVADLLLRYASDEIIVTRYGGDEFLALCINVSKEIILSFIKQVQNDLKELNIEHKASKCTNQLTLSIGFSNREKTEALNSNLLFEEADKALYHSKLSGRNTFSCSMGDYSQFPIE